MRALVVHPGTQHSHRLAIELHRLNALSGLHTGFAVASGGALDQIRKFAPTIWQRRIANRHVEELPPQKVHLQPLLEGAALARMRGGRDDQGVLHWRNERFQRSISQSALEEADVVIGFDTSSWILSERCRRIGKPLIVVQTIGHPDSKKLAFDEIRLRFPEWVAADIPRLPAVRLAEQAEHEGSTLILTSSAFTRQTLVDNGVHESKIRIISHGVDCRRFSLVRKSSARPFRFVFVGLIDARKGIPLLLDAWRKLKAQNAELWLVGSASPQIKELLPTLPGLRYWGSVPQKELPDILSQCDVFVFPSYFEGFGLVLLQAMACGLPFITTTSTAGPDLLKEGDAGWVVPPGDTRKLVDAMSHCLSHSTEMPEYGRTARVVAERFSWQAYGSRWLPLLEEARSLSNPTRSTVRTQTRNEHSGRVLLVHPGTQYSGQLAAQLQKHGMLSEFHTSLAVAGDGLLASSVGILPNRWQKKASARRIPGLQAARLHTRPMLEFAAIAALRLGRDEQEVYYRRNAAFQQSIPDASIKSADAVIGFDTSSWILARRAREHGRVFLLDQSIGHPRSYARVAARVNRQYPEWSQKLAFKSDKDFAREDQEHDDATRIIVPSDFVARTLQENGVDASKIRINPFGVDLERFLPSTTPPPLKPFRFVFAGSLHTRKGIPILLEAWNRLPENHGAELWVVAGGEIPAPMRPRISRSVRLLGKLPQAELARAFHQCHVFVFPSYFEGLAQVQIEAAASGLPVIGTYNSGCEEIVRDRETGFILPAGDVDALYEALVQFIAAPEMALVMRDRLLRERYRWSWSAYGDRWVDILREVDS